MEKRDSVVLGAEGYIPQELLRNIQTKKIHIDINFMLNPEMDVMAKSFAISFYKELRRHGFSENQIADFSTELLKYLGEKLAAYKAKIQKLKGIDT